MIFSFEEVGQKPSPVPTEPGIYLLRHKPTETVYVGKSINLRSRLANHAAVMQSGNHSNKNVAKFFALDSNSESWEFEIAHFAPQEQVADLRETELVWLRKMILQGDVFNCEIDCEMAVRGRPFLGEVRLPAGNPDLHRMFRALTPTERGELIYKALGLELTVKEKDA